MDGAHLLVFGLGYTGGVIARTARASGWQVTVVTRDPARAEARALAQGGIGVAPFADPAAALAGATRLVATAAPGEAGDPVLARHADAIASAPALRWIGYLSTTGVYGDRGGAWVDENTAPAPGQDRSRRRRGAEHAWEAMAARRGASLDLIRLAGIYGPGRSALDDVRSGRAQRIVKPGHAFSRIHVADIAGLVLAAMARPDGVRVLHGADDLPAPSAEVIAEAARLLGLPSPPEVPFEEAARTLSPMALSFWVESRKVANAITKAATGWAPRYPTYREGLAAILAEERGEGAAQQ
ncbi:SDR family oxidoreductase [Elioraea tepidiphila]|uniref:SDR family oxidoreductase n=1 Tax=Elioraea tepidiphila TaxID=457934 RepID=UPI00037839B5|nr:SDR family oxidoreductase [Elioraea tepidiphila]